MLTTSQLARSTGSTAAGAALDPEVGPIARRKQGRPSDYFPARCREAAALAWHGATISEIAAYFGVSIMTLYRWSRAWPEFGEAIKQDKDAADRRIEQRLYDKAAEGDNTAMIFWLKNRRPEEWRDQRDVKVEGKIETGPLIDRDVALAILNALVEASEQPLQIEGEVTDVE
jgi:transposase-like protein